MYYNTYLKDVRSVIFTFETILSAYHGQHKIWPLIWEVNPFLRVVSEVEEEGRICWHWRRRGRSGGPGGSGLGPQWGASSDKPTIQTKQMKQTNKQMIKLKQTSLKKRTWDFLSFLAPQSSRLSRLVSEPASSHLVCQISFQGNGIGRRWSDCVSGWKWVEMVEDICGAIDASLMALF